MPYSVRRMNMFHSLLGLITRFWRILKGDSESMAEHTIPFRYNVESFVRRHGPGGYHTYESYRPWLRDEFSFQCVYCRIRESFCQAPSGFHIDHFVAQSHAPHLGLHYDNLVYCCSTCNGYKLDTDGLPRPEDIPYGRFLSVNSNGTVEALSPEGQLIIDVCRLNTPDRTCFRRRWIGILANIKRSKPELYRDIMGYPSNLPNLSKCRPPLNTRPNGIEQSWFERKNRGELPPIH